MTFSNFAHLVDLSEVVTDECVLWDRGRVGRYGTISGSMRCHRLVCEWAHGPAPTGNHAAHSCGNTLCVNPRHIRWATPAENIADKANHGTTARGERHPQAKLTIDQARAIRFSSLPVRQLVEQFSISRSQVYRIRSGENWGAA